MNTIIETALKKMFAAFGRKPLKQQWDVWVEMANKYDKDTVKEAIERIIQNDEKMPTVARFRAVAKSIISLNRKISTPAIGDCWYCQGTGYVPYLHEPNEKSQVWYTANMGCKCRAGIIKPIRKYFQDNQKLQFEKEAEHYPDLSYPQIVDKIKMKKNKELKSPDLGSEKIERNKVYVGLEIAGQDC